MSETTTTDAPEIGQGGDNPQPEVNPENAAGGPTDQTNIDNTGAEQPAADATTDETVEWLRNKGVDPNDPAAVAAAWRKAEQGFHQTRQESSAKLRESAVEAVQTDDPLANEVGVLKITNAVRDFKDGLRDEGLSKAEIDEIDLQMGELVREKPYLATNLNDAYKLIKADRAEAAIKAAEERGRQAAKAEIAKSSVAGTPKGGASSGVKVDLTEEEARLERFSDWD